MLLAAATALLLLQAGPATAQCCACTGCAASGFCADAIADSLACATLCTDAGCADLTFQIDDVCAGGCDGQPDLPTATASQTPTGMATATPSPTPPTTATSSPSASPATPTATATRTYTPHVPTVAISNGTAVGNPGRTVGFAVNVDSVVDLVTVFVTILFDRAAPIAATQAGTPDCSASGGFDRQGFFEFRPVGCNPSADCNGAALCIQQPSQPVFGDVFSCRIAIPTATAPGTYPLSCGAAGAQTVRDSLPTQCSDGSVIVEDRIPGDCDGDGDVTINELILGVNISLGVLPVTACPAFDTDASGGVSIDELIAAVNAALNG
jgi:hypothetical protein